MSVSSVIRQGLGSTTSDLVRLGLGSGAPPPAAIGPIITLGLKYTPSDVIRLGLGASVSSAATISAAYGTPTSGTTATVGCTTDTASGTLYAVATTSATQPSIAQIKAGQDHTGSAAPWGGSGAVSSISPSLSATGLTAATTYYTHCVQTVATVDSNVDTSDSSWVTDNTGSGGGEEAHDTVSAVLAGAGATVAGTAARVRIHAGTGALAGAGATVAGVAELVPQAGVHGSSGALAGAGAAVVGTATVLHIHAATGVLVGAGAEVVGAASIRLIHEATGVLAGAGAQIVALAARPSANSAPPSGNGPALGRRGRNLSTRTR